MKYLIPLIAILLIMIPLTRNSNTPKTVLDKSDTVLAIGDSLTNGYGASQGESYPDYLRELTGLHIVQSGINGETSSEGLRRLPKLLERYRPKLTILCYGGNDILQKQSLSHLKKNLIKMVSLCKASGSDVLLISVPNFTLFGLEPLPLYEEVAQETDTPLVEGILAKILEDPSLKSDQIHPNAKGYRQLAEAVYEKLKEEGWIETP